MVSAEVPLPDWRGDAHGQPVVRALETPGHAVDAVQLQGRLSQLRDARLLERIAAPRKAILDRWQKLPDLGRPEALRLWAASRSCLADVLDGLTDDRSASDSDRLMLSLSHTEELSVAAGIRIDACLSAVPVGFGIDVESAARGVSGAVQRRIRHPNDGTAALAPIAVWCLKEACFKADPRPPAGLCAYEVLSHLGQPESRFALIRPSLRFEAVLLEAYGCWVALALAFEAGAEP